MISSTPKNTPFVATIPVRAEKIKRHLPPSTLWCSTAFLPLTKPPPLSKEGRSNVREQIAQQPARKRASLPPEEREYTASHHHIGSRSGMHPEDTPYITTTRSCYHTPITEHYFTVDEEGEDVHTRPPTRKSARR